MTRNYQDSPRSAPTVGVLEPILRKDCLIRGSPRLKSRREIDTGIFIQVQAFSGENNNPTPVCMYCVEDFCYNQGKKTKTCATAECVLPFISDCRSYIVDDIAAFSPGEAAPLHFV